LIVDWRMYTTAFLERCLFVILSVFIAFHLAPLHSTFRLCSPIEGLQNEIG
jgi:hypothetical protein